MAKCTAYLVDSSGQFDCERHQGHNTDHQTTRENKSLTWVATGARTQLVGETPPKQRVK